MTIREGRGCTAHKPVSTLKTGMGSADRTLRVTLHPGLGSLQHSAHRTPAVIVPEHVDEAWVRWCAAYRPAGVPG
jgi:hypothetical protein